MAIVLNRPLKAYEEEDKCQQIIVVQPKCNQMQKLIECNYNILIIPKCFFFDSQTIKYILSENKPIREKANIVIMFSIIRIGKYKMF